jgi:hypothetical protein
VKHEVSEAESSEVNFVRAETLDEFASSESHTADTNLDDSDSMPLGAENNPAINDPQAFTSTIRFNPRIFNKYRPHQTGLYDDPLFVNYEYKSFMRKRCIKNTLNESDMNFEDDLCLKCENINIERTHSQANSEHSDLSASQSSNSMESRSSSNSSDSNSHKTSRFRQLSSLLGDLPINIPNENAETQMIEESEVNKERPKTGGGGFLFMKRQQSSLTSLAASVFSQMSQPKTKTLKRSKAKSALPVSAGAAVTSHHESSRTPSTQRPRAAESKLTSTSKKRNLSILVSSSGMKGQLADPAGGEAEKTPKAKKRLVELDSQHQIGFATNQSQPPSNATPSRTILHYFTARTQHGQ